MIKDLQLRALFSDKAFLMSSIVMGMLVGVMIVLAVLYIQPGQLRVPVKYSRYDARNFSLGQWYYLLNYIGFAFVVCVGHILIGAKLYQAKGRVFSLSFMYAGALVLVIACVFFLSITKIVALTQ